MVTTTFLLRYGNRKHEKRILDSVLADKEFINCEWNGAGPVTDGLTKGC
jgi:hypothetical protein